VLAGDATPPDAHEALSGLCKDYWQPLYNFARRGGHSQEDAEDLTKGFILRLLEKDSIAAADRAESPTAQSTGLHPASALCGDQKSPPT